MTRLEVKDLEIQGPDLAETPAVRLTPSVVEFEVDVCGSFGTLVISFWLEASEEQLLPWLGSFQRPVFEKPFWGWLLLRFLLV